MFWSALASTTTYMELSVQLFQICGKALDQGVLAPDAEVNASNGKVLDLDGEVLEI